MLSKCLSIWRQRKAERWYAERKSDILWASASTWLACYFALESQPTDFTSISGAIKTLGTAFEIFERAKEHCEVLFVELEHETRKRFNLPDTWQPKQ